MTLKNRFFTSFTALTLVAGGMTAASILVPATANAQAQSAKALVDAAKARGAIGETSGGYLDVAGDASAAERNAMNEINISRKALYRKKAREENLQIDVVAAIFGEKQLAKATPGQKIMDGSARWRTK